MSAVVSVQKVQDAWPVDEDDTEPGAHGVHVSGEAMPGEGENMSSGHDVHTSLELAPTADDHVPAGHASQLVEFGAAW